MSKTSIASAGIDTGRRKLDVAIDDAQKQLQVENTAEGHRRLFSWLRRHKVGRVGIEASGGYEQLVVEQLRANGFVVIVFQPAQVRAYAKFHGKRAKNDRIDAALMAACAAETRTVRAPPDPRLAAFAMHVTAIEQITQDIACFKTRCETRGWSRSGRIASWSSKPCSRLSSLSWCRRSGGTPISLTVST